MTITNRARRNARRLGSMLFLSVILASITSGGSQAQSFSSGSDDSDGDLTIAADQGTIVFDPTDMARWGRVLDPDGDGVYNFRTITINSGSTLKLPGDKVNRPVYWLASGNIVINGILDLSGASGTSTSDVSVRRLVAIPGSGGFAGGAGGRSDPPMPRTAGDGPGGGSGGVSCFSNNAGIVVCGRGGTFSGNRYLIPLIGGSGGEGGLANGFGQFDGGGAGGGAVLLASSSLITLNGTVTAAGGAGARDNGFQMGNNIVGGGGSGGAIRLVAPTLAGTGSLNVTGGAGIGGIFTGSAGWVRLEGFQISNFSLTAGGDFVSRGSPVDQATLRPASSIRVTAIDGIEVPVNPSGSFTVPDLTISKNTPVNVDIQATGIPHGTVVTLQVYPQTPTDSQTVNLPTAQATLSGTLQSSTATATFTFPYGFSRGYVRATWTQ